MASAASSAYGDVRARCSRPAVPGVSRPARGGGGRVLGSAAPREPSPAARVRWAIARSRSWRRSS